MTTAKLYPAPSLPRQLATSPAASQRLDQAVAILSTIFALGIFLDGWAHNNIADLIDTFFTPYHALLYGGYLMVALLLSATYVRNLAAGQRWSAALPAAYPAAMLGVVLFAIGGIGDFLWHEAFGFEDDIEALLSPTHLMLAAGAMLYVSAPLRSAWRRADSHKVRVPWRTFWPALVAMTIILSLLTFFTQYVTFARPGALINPPADADFAFLKSVHGIFSLLMPSALATGAILYLMRRWRLPVGSIAALIGVNYTLMFVMTWDDSVAAPWTLPTTLLAAVVVEWLYQRWQPSVGRLTAVRWFGFLTPFTISVIYIATLLTTHGLWWAIHMWAGIPFVTGVVGLLLSFLAFPSPMPPAEERA